MTRMLAGAACAALVAFALPARAATGVELSPPASYDASDTAVARFYAERSGAPLWLKSGADSSAARELMGILRRADLDGMPSGPAFRGPG